MRKFFFLLVLIVAALLLTSSSVSANTINRTPDATFPLSSDLTKPEYWGPNCVQYGGEFDGDVAYLPSGYSLLVLKSATNHFVWYSPPTGFYGTPTFQNISHSIVCRGATNPDYVINVDCEGWEVIYIPDGSVRAGTVVASGKWQTPDTLEAVKVFIEPLEITVDVLEPRECYKCVPEMTFYWSDGWCEIRQREGPIGGQTAPFAPMQNYYCGCEYAHYNWIGRWVNSCDNPVEYKYWSELPFGCGVSCPEALVTP